MKTKVGKVTEEERSQILSLFERKNGLQELAKILTTDNQELYEKVVMDLGTTNMKFQKWWYDMAMKYGWKSAEEGNWEIDFDTCDIYLNSFE